MAKTPAKKILRICKNGHRYYRSSDCPVCPICESERNEAADFLSGISAPARRALESLGIKTLKQLSKFSEEDLLKLHGFGPGSIPKLKAFLKSEGLSFKKQAQDS